MACVCPLHRRHRLRQNSHLRCCEFNLRVGFKPQDQDCSALDRPCLNSQTPIDRNSAITALLLVAIWLIARAYRRRRNQPQEEIQNVLISNLDFQTLQDLLGQTVVSLVDVAARMHIDWWTRGTMRIVDLRWSGSRRTVYRSFRRRRCLDLLAFLQEQGLDAQ